MARIRSIDRITVGPGQRGEMTASLQSAFFDIIDATRPAGRDYAERLVISDDQRARARSLLATAGVKI